MSLGYEKNIQLKIQVQMISKKFNSQIEMYPSLIMHLDIENVMLK